MAGAEEIVVGIVSFRLDPARRPRPEALAEEDLLFRRLRRALAGPPAAGLAADRFPEWWRAARRGEVA